MFRRVSISLFLLVFLGGVISYSIFTYKKGKEINTRLQVAYAAYVKGEIANTLSKRQDSFNRSLEIYTDFERQYKPQYGNGKLYYNIANTFFQLEEYPLATLYYYRALALLPRSEKVSSNLKRTLQKLGIEPEKKETVFSNIFFFHHLFSFPERMQAFFGMACIAILFTSLYIWTRKNGFKKSALLTSFLSFLFLLSIGYSHYLDPVEGVIIQSTGLYRDAGTQYAKVVQEPILSGSKVEVLDILKQGTWLKVVTQEGDLGYLPQESIRII